MFVFDDILGEGAGRRVHPESNKDHRLSMLRRCVQWVLCVDGRAKLSELGQRFWQGIRRVCGHDGRRTRPLKLVSIEKPVRRKASAPAIANRPSGPGDLSNLMQNSFV